MRRIYESAALRRDDDEPFAPNERDGARPRAFRSVPGAALSRLLVPEWLRYRAISLDVSTPRSTYPIGARIPVRVTMRNVLPVPVTIPTRSPVLWTWSIDGVREASRVPPRDPPDEAGAFGFERGERKRFERRWDQLFRVSDAEWEPAGPGTYTVGAGINVEDPAEKGVYAETTVRVEPGAE